MQAPFLISYNTGSDRVGVLAFWYKEVGKDICFLDIGFNLTDSNPFHVMEGPFSLKAKAKDGMAHDVYLNEKGESVRELTSSDRLWANWKQWVTYIESPDGIGVIEKAIDSLNDMGALVKNPL